MALRKHCYWLDWSRFAAAFLVVACHARGYNWQAWGDLDPAGRNWLSWLFFAATRPGLEAVVIFFVLSGFLVGGRVWERLADRTFDIREYIIDRITRIYLPLIPALLFTAVINLICHYPLSAGAFFGNLFGLQGIVCNSFGLNAPLWSLAFEIWFYALAAFIAIAFMSSVQARLLAFFGLAIVFIAFTRLEAYFLFCWCIGVFGYRLINRNLSRTCFLAGLALFLLGSIMSQLLSESNSINLKNFTGLLPSLGVTHIILSTGFGIMVPFLAQRQPRSRMGISFESWGTPLAAFSYTLYLTHYPLLNLWAFLQPQRFATIESYSFSWFIVRIILCLLVAWLLYLPFEAQTAHVRAWIRRRLPNNKTNN